MPKQVPCTCGGSNENCKFCFGAGFTTVPWVEDGSVLQPSTFQVEVAKATDLGDPTISAAKTKPEKQARWISCPKGSFRALSGEVSVMGQKNRTVPEAFSKTAKFIKKCGLCGNEISANLYQKHLDECPKRFGAIGELGYLVLQSRPGKKRSRTQRRFPRQGAECEGTTGGVANYGSKLYETQDRLDATRNMGFIARESGRYGSHPLHDGFDDDSGPEKKF